MELKAAQTKSHLLSIFINKKIPQAQTTYVTISRLSETLIGIDIPTLMRCNIFPVQNINNLLLVSIFWKGYIIISFWDNASDRSWKKQNYSLYSTGRLWISFPHSAPQLSHRFTVTTWYLGWRSTTTTQHPCRCCVERIKWVGGGEKKAGFCFVHWLFGSEDAEFGLKCALFFCHPWKTSTPKCLFRKNHIK